MSRSIDNRVVEMEFDNARFEKNVSQSLSTLDKLKAALSFKGVEDNFESVENATGGLSKSFSALETIAVGALLNIGNKVADWAQSTIKDLSGVQNVIEGFSKFSKITQSSATLAAQGFASDEIERELSRLNWFTDETSYNLTDMVDNISKFTASGQGLKESSDAMQGIALWAALSGQNAQTASRAMYQLSQAMSTYMKREDWRSIQNANMDTIEFRRMALDAAVRIGTLERLSDGSYRSLVEGLKKEGSEAFTESQFVERLTSGMWFTKDVMMDVYRSYAKAAEQIYEYVENHTGATVRDAIDALGDSLDTFGLKAFKAGQEARTWEDAINSVKDALSTKWESIFESIFGKYEDATSFFTDLSYAFYDMFVEPKARTVEAFRRWSDEGGSAILRGSIIDALYLILDVINKVRDAFDDFFYWDSAKKYIDDATKAYSEYEKQLSNSPLESIEQDMRGLKTRDKAWEAISEYYHMDSETDDAREDYLIGKKTASLFKFSDAVSGFINKLKSYSDETDAFRRILYGVFSVIDIVKQAISGLVSSFKPLFDSGSGQMIKTLIEGLAKVGDWLTKLNAKVRELDFFKKFFETLLAPVVNLKKAIVDFFNVFGTRLKERFANMKKSTDDLSGAFSGIKDVLKGMLSSIASWWRNLFSNFDAEKAVDSIFNAVDRIKQAFYDISGIEPGTFGDRMRDGLEKIQNALSDFRNTAPAKIKEAWEISKGWFETAFTWIKDHWGGIAETIKTIWEGVWAFLSGIWNGIKGLFSGDDGLSFEDLKDSLKTLGDILGTLIKIIGQGLKPILDGMKNTLENMSFGELGGFLAGGGVLALGTGIYKVLNPVHSLLKGLGSILDGFGNILDGFAHSIDAKALKEAATGIGILVGSLFFLVSMPQEQLVGAVTVLSIVLAAMSKAMGSMSNITSHMAISKGGFFRDKNSAGMMFLEISAGLILIALALKAIAKIPTDDLYTALFVITVMVAVMVAAVKALAKLYTAKGPNNALKQTNSNNQFNNNSIIKMGGPLGTLLGFAIAMWVVANAIGKMSAIIETNIGGFIGSVVVVAAVIVGITAAVKSIAKADLDSSNIAKTILSFAVLIFVVAEAIKIMGEVDSMKMLEAGAILAIIIYLMGDIITKTKGRTFKNFDQLASGLKSFALVIAAVGVVIYCLAQIPEDQLLYGGIAVVGITAILAAMVALSTWKKFKPANFKKMVDCMIYMAVAIGILAVVVYGLAQLSGEELAKGLIGLAAIAAIIAALSVIANKTGGGMEKVGKTFAYIGAAAALLGIGLLAVVESLKLLSDESINVDKAFEKISKIIKNFLRDLPEWLALISIAITTFVINLAANLIVEFVNMIDDLIKKFKDNKTIEKLVTGFIEVACMVINAVSKNLQQIVDALGGFVLDLLISLGNWLTNNSAKIKEAITKFLTGLLDVFLEFFDGIGKRIFYKLTGEGEEEWNKWKEGAKEDILGWFAMIVGAVVSLWNPLIGTLTTILGLITTINTYSDAKAAQREAESKWLAADPDAAKKLQEYRVAEVDAKLAAGVYGPNKTFSNLAYVAALNEALKQAEDDFISGSRIKAGKYITFAEGVQYGLAAQEMGSGYSESDILRYSRMSDSEKMVFLDKAEAAKAKNNSAKSPTYTYNQTINTTGQISDTELYRQTKNLLSRTAAVSIAQ